MAIFIPLFAAMVWSYWNVAGDHGSTLLFMLPCYLALYILYPSDQGTRYLLPAAAGDGRLLVVVRVEHDTASGPDSHRASDGTLAGGHRLQHAFVVSSSEHEPRVAGVDAFTEIMRSDPRPAVCWNASFGVRELAMVASDRWCAEMRGADAPIPADVGWLVAGIDSPNSPGFVERARQGDLKLLARVQHISQSRSKLVR